MKPSDKPPHSPSTYSIVNYASYKCPPDIRRHKWYNNNVYVISPSRLCSMTKASTYMPLFVSLVYITTIMEYYTEHYLWLTISWTHILSESGLGTNYAPPITTQRRACLCGNKRREGYPPWVTSIWVVLVPWRKRHCFQPARHVSSTWMIAESWLWELHVSGFSNKSSSPGAGARRVLEQAVP